MSVVEHEVLGRFAELPRRRRGPVTASRRRRNLVLYLAVAALGLVPTWLGMSPAWQAAGLGLLFPGGGFSVAGGGWLLAIPATVFLFWLSCVAWFWAGAIVAPLAVWGGAALVAAGVAGPQVWGPAPWASVAGAAGLLGWMHWRDARRRARDREQYAARQGFFETSRAEVNERAVTEPEAGTRELDLDTLKAARYNFDRALQPVGEYAGYTIIDQFQPAALRYQINHLGYGLSLMQHHYTPNFTGYLSQAQKNLVETYLDPQVWSYWVLESMWGHLNFSNFDPARKDNVMLTGYVGMQVNAYMNSGGVREYGEPGSMTFRLNERTAYPHDAHTIAQSVLDNFERSDFCLYPCEPNWIYPVCNMYGMGSLKAHDTVFGTSYVQGVLPGWLENLETEFTDDKGSLVGLRSYLTGHEISIFNGEAGFAFFANVFHPQLGRRLWAVGRKEIGACLAPDANGNTRVTIPREAMAFIDTIDVGNYRPGMLFAYAAVAICGREFGDDEIAEAALRAMDQDCGLVEEDGVRYYTDASGMANAWAVEAKLMRTGDFRNTFAAPLPLLEDRGPILAQASYPEVLVAKAVSGGEDLELVLYPGNGAGRQALGLAQLDPAREYRVVCGEQSSSLRADAAGKAKIEVDLAGRTAVTVRPG
ncbi:MAG: linalool dehydratase/isomerase domain-containing protein [Gammaproteobacteria bacterium]